ncbi:fungal-specific transcription factor domain-containing protein [Exophiala viscosa]|uniref:fungal-specific transcription factor domain-containing protein n=1 Tax=Exophiala viscosa TaxID=2486360 RepID=UPI0021904D62|nr:fungal-specific transcription factor domain-containing protein [Exophiala viscosa]
MLQNPYGSKPILKERQRKRTGSRTQIACVNCKERKLKCDSQLPACSICRRFGLVCLVEDPTTKRHQPRNYLEILEERVAYLEGVLAQENQAGAIPGSLHQVGLQYAESQTTTPSATLSFTQEHLSPSRSGTADEGRDEVGNLAAKVGMLSLAAGAEPHYLGASSTFAFSRVINSALLQAVPRRAPDTHNGHHDTRPLPAPCLLPDYESCVKLSDAYFREIHSQYPFLHEPTFRLWEAKLMPSEMTDMSQFEPVALFFLYMVYAIGALLLPRVGYDPKQLYASAQLFVDEVLKLENLEVIQAYLCYAVYSLRSPAGTSVWRLSGLALRQCIEFGYHRHVNVMGMASTSTPLRTELRKRAFWCAWTVDTMAATILGRPLALQYQMVDCEYPMDIDDMYISDYGILGTVRSPHEPPTSMTKALHAFRVRCLLGRIHASLYSDIHQSNPPQPAYQARVDELRKELEDWRASIPPRVPHQGEMLSMFSCDEWFDFSYSDTILHLYRGQLTDLKGTSSDKTFLECMQAAENICHGYRRQLLGKSTTYTWGALHTVFMAGLTYLHCLWSSAAVRGRVRQDVVSSTCTDCTIVLVLIAQWNDAAAPYRDIFEALATRTMTMLVDKGAETPTALDFAPQADSLDSENFSQWISDITEGGMADGLGDLLNGLVGEMPAMDQDTLP